MINDIRDLAKQYGVPTSDESVVKDTLGHISRRINYLDGEGNDITLHDYTVRSFGYQLSISAGNAMGAHAFTTTIKFPFTMERFNSRLMKVRNESDRNFDLEYGENI